MFETDGAGEDGHPTILPMHICSPTPSSSYDCARDVSEKWTLSVGDLFLGVRGLVTAFTLVSFESRPEFTDTGSAEFRALSIEFHSLLAIRSKSPPEGVTPTPLVPTGVIHIPALDTRRHRTKPGREKSSQIQSPGCVQTGFCRRQLRESLPQHRISCAVVSDRTVKVIWLQYLNVFKM
jgi:hypothetical protein